MAAKGRSSVKAGDVVHRYVRNHCAVVDEHLRHDGAQLLLAGWSAEAAVDTHDTGVRATPGLSAFTACTTSRVQGAGTHRAGRSRHLPECVPAPCTLEVVQAVKAEVSGVARTPVS